VLIEHTTLNAQVKLTPTIKQNTKSTITTT